MGASPDSTLSRLKFHPLGGIEPEIVTIARHITSHSVTFLVTLRYPHRYTSFQSDAEQTRAIETDAIAHGYHKVTPPAFLDASLLLVYSRNDPSLYKFDAETGRVGR